MTSLRRHGALAGALTLLFALVAITWWMAVRHTGGHLGYALDDAYIHMAMAKNLVQHGAWSVSLNEFASSSSSPLWLLTLAGAYAVFGISEMTPIIMNIVFAVALLCVIHVILLKRALTGVRAFVVMGALIVLTPMGAIMFSGLEHVLQILVDLVFIVLLGDLLASPEQSARASRRVELGLLAVTPFVVSARYEGLFLVGIAGLMLLWRRRLGYAVVMGVLAALPIVAYGLFSMAHGAYFLPNSLMLKGNVPTMSLTGVLKMFGLWVVLHANDAPYLSVLAALLLGLLALHWSRTQSLRNAEAIMALVTVGTMVLHLNFAKTGTLYRYDAYLVALAVVVLALFVAGAQKDAQRMTSGRMGKLLVGGFVVAAAITPLSRSLNAFIETPLALRNIHEQQYQMARFVHRFYEGAPIAANDVGAINYFADIQTLDLWGLVSMDVARAKRAKTYTTATIESLTQQRHADIAIIYDRWFLDEQSPPSSWVRVGQWTISNNVICGDKTVSFYATRPEAVASLTRNLQAFSASLPSSVEQTGAYTER